MLDVILRIYSVRKTKVPSGIRRTKVLSGIRRTEVLGEKTFQYASYFGEILSVHTNKKKVTIVFVALLDGKAEVHDDVGNYENNAFFYDYLVAELVRK